MKNQCYLRVKESNVVSEAHNSIGPSKSPTVEYESRKYGSI
jgi:hypothetical protein